MIDQSLIDTKKIFEEYKAFIEAALDQILSAEANPHLARTPLLESVRYSVLAGGKRLRAVLPLLVAEAILDSQGAKAPVQVSASPAFGLALALEMVHAGSLIHDDLPCMDDDDLRRGKPSNHKVFGEAMALLAGDFLLIQPIEILLRYTPAEFRVNLSEVSLEFVQGINSMIAGQAMDMEFSSNNDLKLRQEDLELMQSLKTGALLRAAIVLAAKLACAKRIEIEALEIYSRNLGLAFQIADDILDCTASTEELGKTQGKDDQQNKITFVKLHGLEKAREIAGILIKEAKEALDQIHGDTAKLEAIADYVIFRSN